MILHPWPTGWPKCVIVRIKKRIAVICAVANKDTPCVDGLPTSVLTFSSLFLMEKLIVLLILVEKKVMKNYDPLTVTVVSDAAVRSGEYALLSVC